MKLSKNSKIRLIGQISLKERKFEFIFETDISGKLKPQVAFSSNTRTGTLLKQQHEVLYQLHRDSVTVLKVSCSQQLQKADFLTAIQ